MYKDFDIKKMLFRMIVAGGTLFLGAFCKQYATLPDLQQAFQMGEQALIQGVILAFGGDQLIYHYQVTQNK